ncbi:MAG: hypothetical protein J6Y58_04310, partial [Clostridiales bacterium]|nr:hypothetical protein [Clostridiales bacterium]
MNGLFKPDSENQEVVENKPNRKLMFVCSGNTCRSPMAESIFRHIFRASGPHHMIGDPDTEAKIEVSSAGAFARGDEPYTPYAVRVIKYEYDEDISSG